MQISILATLYSYEPVIASVTKLGASNLFLLIDQKPDETQKKAIQEVKNSLGKYITIELIKTEVYDIVKVAEDSVKLIDKLSPHSKILLNISAARKTKALGLMFAGYARADKIDKIFYITKETKDIVFLPKMGFNLNKSQNSILKYYRQGKNHKTTKEIYLSLNMSKSMFYKALNELEDMGFIQENKITDAGRIALL